MGGMSVAISIYFEGEISYFFNGLLYLGDCFVTPFLAMTNEYFKKVERNQSV
jgi:hypothetical protein